MTRASSGDLDRGGAGGELGWGGARADRLQGGGEGGRVLHAVCSNFLGDRAATGFSGRLTLNFSLGRKSRCTRLSSRQIPFASVAEQGSRYEGSTRRCSTVALYAAVMGTTACGSRVSLPGGTDRGGWPARGRSHVPGPHDFPLLVQRGSVLGP